MRRFLLVGCGGSGGATLQFVMDQLRADLARLGINRLPRGWQFLHIDVPGSPPGDPGGYPLPPAVGSTPEGQYVGLTWTGATYPNVARPVEQRLAERGRLNGLVRWRPSPDAVDVSIAEGAGQYRAVGRMLTLSQAVRIRDALMTSVGMLQGPAMAELQALAETISAPTAADVARPPVVIVVSSMAGGAGASMALDVCRMISTVPNVNPGAIALFLYTAEVFEPLAQYLRLGIEANAAAMIGELIAAQSGASGLDAEMLAAVGVSGATAGAPFGRVVPIGSRIGSDGSQFGDGSLGSVYRGIGRGLASLMMSGTATRGLMTVAVENPQVPSFPRDHFGYGVPCSRLAWGAFGYASIDLGRDRYAEFAAQRLARVAVDRLLDGRRRHGDSRSATEWSRDLVQRVLWDRLCQAVRLPTTVDPEALDGWLLALRGADIDAAAKDIVAASVDPVYGRVAQVDARNLAEGLPTALRARRAAVVAAVDMKANSWAFEWFLALRESLLTVIIEVVADYGLRPAAALLERLDDRIGEYAAKLREQARNWKPADVVAPNARDLTALGHIRGFINADHGLLSSLRHKHQVPVKEALGAALAERLGQVIADMADGVVAPLLRAVEEASAVLAQERENPADFVGRAMLRTDSYAAWPGGSADGHERFAHAQNEVLLTPSSDFEALFEQHVVLDGQVLRDLRTDADRADLGVPALRAEALSFDDGLADVITEVLRVARPRTEGEPDSRPLQTETAWWPGAFREDPRATQGARLVPAQRGSVRTRLTTAHVLALCRAYVNRADAFHDFIGQSMASYLGGDGTGQVQRDQRADELRAAFRKALNLARPLVAVNGQTVADLYPGGSVQNYYSFSALPVPPTLAGTLAADLAGPEVLPETAVQFQGAVALGQSSNATRIDVFGSHEPYPPVVFRSLLEPVARRWNQLPNDSRSAFWTWRRSRRLAGAIPAGEAHRKAMVAGWYVARLTGCLRHPGEKFTPGAAIFDESAGWVSFPDPTLTLDRFWYGKALDCLPAVLESMSIALAQCYDSPDLAALQPYRLLREMYDDGNGDYGIEEGPAARRRLAEWIRTGKVMADVPPVRFSGSADGQPEMRQEALLAGLRKSRHDIGRAYLAAGEKGAEGGGAYSEVRVGRIDQIPLFHEIAADCYEALGRLVQIVETIDPAGALDLGLEIVT